MSATHITDIDFSAFDLDPRLARGLDDAGFIHCTPIQAQTLPISLAGQDVAGQAQTGTGKTGAFLVAVLQRLLDRPEPEGREPRDVRALIIAPTRELAVQIHKDALLLGIHTGLKSTVVYGGAGYQSQADELRAGTDILIGTPGRLIDYFKQKLISFRHAEAVVLDEADRMFDLGFLKDIRFLLRRLPPPDKRLGLLFSATLSLRVTELAYEHMNNPAHVEIEPEKVTADHVHEELYHTAMEEKIPLLIGLLQKTDPSRTIVFTNTKHVAERVWAYLEGNQLKAGILSGDVPQKKRLSLLRDFQDGTLSILVATDVAARGLHISDVSHVINFDLPQDAEDYVHRIGRTARFGSRGEAISFGCEEYVYSLPDIETYIGHRIPVSDIGDRLATEIAPPVKLERKPRGGRPGRGGGRPGGGGGRDGRRPPRRK